MKQLSVTQKRELAHTISSAFVSNSVLEGVLNRILSDFPDFVLFSLYKTVQDIDKERKDK